MKDQPPTALDRNPPALLEIAHSHEAKSIGADLSGADLTGTDLAGTDLTEADLTGATLIEADLSGANLEFARGLDQSQIDQARGDSATILPDGLVRPRDWLHDSADDFRIGKNVA